MTDDDFETEQNLLGSILSINDENEHQDQKKLSVSDECNQAQTQTKLLRQYNFQTADTFSKSFEQISLGSDQICSPISPDQKLKYKNPGVCTSFSSDNQTSLENSMIFGNVCCFDYFSIQSDQFSPIYYSQNNPIWPQYQKSNQNLDIQLEIDIENMCGNQVLSRKVQKYLRPDKPIKDNKYSGRCKLIAKNFQKTSLEITQSRKFLKKELYNNKFRSSNSYNHMQLNYLKILSVAELSKTYRYHLKNDHLIVPFIQEIKQNIKSLLTDQNGKYVILKCLENLSIDVVRFILKPTEELGFHMCDSQYGCKIIQKLIDNYPKQVDTLVQICITNQNLLYKSQHGNHILQYAIKLPKYLDIIANYILNHLENLCFNKYASNTVEDILKYLTPKLKNNFVQILMKPSENNGMFIFLNLAINPFGNYVVKKVLQIFDQEHKQQLVDLMKQNLRLLYLIKQSEYGQRIYILLTTQLNDQN